jgi:hypothetical protein
MRSSWSVAVNTRLERTRRWVLLFIVAWARSSSNGAGSNTARCQGCHVYSRESLEPPEPLGSAMSTPFVGR